MNLLNKAVACLIVWCLSGLVWAQEEAPENKRAKQQSEQTDGTGILSSRFQADRKALDNQFSITQHRPNYILPISYVTNPSNLRSQAIDDETVDRKEAKFQLSIKLPLYLQDSSADGVYFGFTLASFWQLYNSEVSKPFRETSYEPEIFYQRDADINLLGYDFSSFQIGFNHMSNGQSGTRSRSWNRLFASILFSDHDNLYYLKAWYRVPEDEKSSPDDPTGDDNPNISDYFGRAEFGYGTRLGNFKLLALLRNNLSFSDNRGSIELNVSYPLSNRYELLFQYFNGYGESLIDYNRSQERIGIGFQLMFL